MTEDDNGKAEVTAIDQTPDGRLWQSVRQQSQTLPLPDNDKLQSKVFRLGVKVSYHVAHDFG